MQRDDPTGHRPGPPAPAASGAGGDTVLAALAHRLRARSERQQLLTERLRSGELRPGALADLAELAAAARRGVRDGDHILVMSGTPGPDRGGVGPVPLGQALSAAVAASEAASRTVVPPTPGVSLAAQAAPVFGQILAELLAHATTATAPGERLELHTRWAPDGGLVLELASPRPVPTRTPAGELDRALAAGRPDGPVAPQEIGLYLAARLARSLGGRLGVHPLPGVTTAPGLSPVAVLALPPSALSGGRPDDGEEHVPEAAADEVPAGSGPAPPAVDPEPSVPPWPPLPVASERPATNGVPPVADPDAPVGPGPVRLPVPPALPGSHPGILSGGPPADTSSSGTPFPGPPRPGGAGPFARPDHPGPRADPDPRADLGSRPGAEPPSRADDGDIPSVTEAMPVPGTTPPVELFGPFDSEVPVPMDDLDGTPIFAAVASAWFRDPNTPPSGEPGTNGGPRPPGDEPPNWTAGGDAEFEAARDRANRVMEPPVTVNGLPMRRPGQQMVPPSRRDAPPVRPKGSGDRQPDRVRNRLASYQRGLREGRHRAAEEHGAQAGPPPSQNGVNGSAPHGRNGHVHP